ncbi:ComEA family DNA-binding protein [Halocola ammonii]
MRLNDWMKIGCSLLLCFCFLQMQAQEEASETDLQKQDIIEQRIETIAGNLDEDTELDYTTLFDDLNFFYDNPLNLNAATAEELRQLYLLTDIQINYLLEHIECYGKLESIFELQAVEGFDRETINNLRPFITVSDEGELAGFSIKEMLTEGKHDLFLRYTRILEQQQGYTDIPEEDLDDPPNRFLGNQDRYYLRYRYKFRKNLSVGLTAEKDPGEEFFEGTQKQGFDFYSGHLFYSDDGWLRAAALGDFHAQFGQGLTVWSGLGFGKSSFALNVKRNQVGIRPYTSVDENLFMRGGAVTLGHKNWELTTFYSRKMIDANVTAIDSLDGEPRFTVSSFQATGFHRTENEVADKDAILEEHIGGNLSFDKRKFHFGITAMRSTYDADVQRTLQPYNKFQFDNNENFVTGLDYNWVKNNFNFFGEFSRSQNGGFATINGVLVALDPRLSVTVVHRHFTKDYQSLYTNAFSESSRPANERGIYFGLDAKLRKKWNFSAYFDQFRFPWLQFRSDAPADGYEWLAQLNWNPARNTEIYFRARYTQKDRNVPEPDVMIDYPVAYEQTNYRINASYKVSESFKLKSRVEWNIFNQVGTPREQGFLIAQDVQFKKLESPWSVSFRYALFDTESFDSRIYSYESDLLYAFSIPAYFYRGSRVYAMVKWDVARGVDLWVRWSRWFYDNQENISTGLNQIDGQVKSELKMQLRVRF